MRVLSRQELADAIEQIAANGFCQDIAEIVEEELHQLTPADAISTAQCAEQRKFRAPEGGGTTRYSIEQTPYNKGPMDAHDNPACNLIIMPKPSRSGGTTVGENYLFKLIKHGPMGWVSWYLTSDDAVKKYVDAIVSPMFDLHPDLAAKIGAGRSDNNATSKKIGGYPVEWLSTATKSNFTNREPIYMVLDETDASNGDVADKPVTEIEARQKRLGKRKKGFVCSHPDKGWGSGVAAAWVDSSRGIFIMRCAECHLYAAAHATKFWEDVPEFRLEYNRDEEKPRDERLEMAERTAGMACPHCGAMLTDEQRRAMVDECLTEERWMHRGQYLNPEKGIVGTMTATTRWGFWVHGLMLKTVTMAEIAKGREEAIVKWETSRRSGELKTYFARQLGEIFDGTVKTKFRRASSLRKRAVEEQVVRVGECPDWVRFITAAVDLKKKRFDVSFRGWDLEGRSIWLDRFPLKQIRAASGSMRDLAPQERIEDWDVLFDQVIDRTFPIIGRPGWAMPVAAVGIDIGDGNVTAKGREFARRAVARGRYWGLRSKPWSKVRLTQGSRNPNAEPFAPLKKDKDDAGKQIDPLNCEFTIGSSRLKEMVHDYLGVDDGGPGQCFFAEGIEARFYDEYYAERQIDGKWEETGGPNESLDLFAIEIAVRLMLKPDRKDINWETGPLPPWARPVRLSEEGGDPEVVGEAARETPPQKRERSRQNLLERFQALNHGPEGE